MEVGGLGARERIVGEKRQIPPGIHRCGRLHKHFGGLKPIAGACAELGLHRDQMVEGEDAAIFQPPRVFQIEAQKIPHRRYLEPAQRLQRANA